MPTAQTARLLAEIDHQFGLLRTADVPFDELETAKDDLLRREPASFEDTAGTLNTLSNIATFDLPLDTFKRQFATIHSVDAADVRKIAASRYTPDRLCAVVVGDWEALKPSVGTLGWSIEVR